MKKLLYPFAFIYSWIAWIIGHVSYLIMSSWNNETWIKIWFEPYQGGMSQSSRSQDFVGGKGRLWPWGEVLTEEQVKDLLADK